jgi:hypothetical protein
MSNQTSAKAIAAAAAAADDTDDVDALDGDLLRGGKRIAKFNYGSDKKEDVKRLYAEAHRLPVFQDVPGGPLLAFKSKLREHYKALSAAKELAIAAAAAQPETQNAATTTEREARLSRQSKRRPRDAVGRKFNKQREREIA